MTVDAPGNGSAAAAAAMMADGEAGSEWNACGENACGRAAGRTGAFTGLEERARPLVSALVPVLPAVRPLPEDEDGDDGGETAERVGGELVM